jgi:hypothetical protein
MKLPRPFLRAIGMIVLIAVGCLQAAENAVSGSATSVPDRPLQVIELPRQILTFQPSRDDISVGSVEFAVYYWKLKARQFWTSEEQQYLAAIRVNGQPMESAILRLRLKQAGKNQFELPAMKIEFPSRDQGGPLYFAIRPFFNEVTVQQDSLFFAHPDDWGALLTYCTDETDDPSKVNGRIGANRVVTLSEFKARLAKPLVIALKDRPLNAEAGHWPMLNDAYHVLGPDDVRAIEQQLRDRGEKYPISIMAMPDRPVLVGVGDKSFFENSRVYEFVRQGATWQVAAMKPYGG